MHLKRYYNILGLSSLFLLLTNYCASGSGIHKDLREYEWEDINKVGLISNAAYWSYGSITMDVFNSIQSIESSGWDIQYRGNSPGSGFFRAENGPLVVLAFKGTTDLDNIITDLDLIRFAVTEGGQKGCVHRGIYSYSKGLPTLASLFNPDKGDEFLILTGHSLGGAVAQLKGFEAYDLFANSELTNFCSIATFGAPAILDKPLKTRFNQIFPGYSNVQFSFGNDLVADFTRGPTLLIPELSSIDSSRSVFKRTGSKITLKSEGLLSHSMEEYLKALQDEKSRVLSSWPDNVYTPLTKEAPFSVIEDVILDKISSKLAVEVWKGQLELYKICLNPNLQPETRLDAWLILHNYYSYLKSPVSSRFIKLTKGLIGENVLTKEGQIFYEYDPKTINKKCIIVMLKALINSRDIFLRKLAIRQFKNLLSSGQNYNHFIALTSFIDNDEFIIDDDLSLQLMRMDLREELLEKLIISSDTDSSLRRELLARLMLPLQIIQIQDYLDSGTLNQISEQDAWKSLKRRVSVEEGLEAYSSFLEQKTGFFVEDVKSPQDKIERILSFRKTNKEYFEDSISAQKRIEKFLNSEHLPTIDMPDREGFQTADNILFEYSREFGSIAWRKERIYTYWLSINRPEYKYDTRLK